MTERKTVLPYDELLRILDHSYDEILVFDAEGTVVYVTPSCLEHYGKEVMTMMGKSSFELVEQNLWGPRVSPLAKQYKRRMTMKQRCCTGSQLLTTAIPVFDDDGEVKYIIENVRDITAGGGLTGEIEETRRFFAEKDVAEEELGETPPLRDFVAESDVMRDLIRMARRIAAVNSNVLITGDSGSGKGVMARYIHDCGPRRDSPFMEINCAALPETLVESELFGYTRGAFSGAASKGKEGLIRAAGNGTLFLDEIGELPLNVQAKLLQFIQDGKYFEVGGTKQYHADCRIIAATNQELESMVNQNLFRRDLYYRLKVFEIAIPPLIERRADILPLIQFFLNKYNERYGRQQLFSPEALRLLYDYPWPGNVRELANAVERSVVMAAKREIGSNNLPKAIRNYHGSSDDASGEFPVEAVGMDLLSLEDVCLKRYQAAVSRAEEEKKEVVRALYRQLKSSRKVASALRLSQSTAYRYIQNYCKDLIEE